MHGPHADSVRVLLRWLKDGPPGAIPILLDGRTLGSLVAVTWEDAGDADALERLARWHEAGLPGAPATRATARRWLQREVLPDDDRVLFWIEDDGRRRVGYLGLAYFDFAANRVGMGGVVGTAPLTAPLARGAVAA